MLNSEIIIVPSINYKIIRNQTFFATSNNNMNYPDTTDCRFYRTYNGPIQKEESHNFLEFQAFIVQACNSTIFLQRYKPNHNQIDFQ